MMPLDHSMLDSDTNSAIHSSGREGEDRERAELILSPSAGGAKSERDGGEKPFATYESHGLLSKRISKVFSRVSVCLSLACPYRSVGASSLNH